MKEMGPVRTHQSASQEVTLSDGWLRLSSSTRGWQYASNLVSALQGNLVHIQEAVPGRKDFPLPTLGPKLEQLREEVRIGRGFQLLR